MENPGILAGIGFYFAVIIFVGYLMKSKNKGAEDFLVGGRSFGLFYNTGTLTACWIGGVLVIGVPGTLYGFGVWDSEARWGLLVSYGGMCCLLVAGLFFMRKLWALKLLSLGDYYYQRFGKTAGIISTIIMSGTFVLWISVQIVSFAKVGVAVVGLSLNTWVLISMVVICTYTILGGLWAVCLTDIIQVGVVVLSMLIILPLAISAVGGWEAFSSAVPTEKLDMFPKDYTVPSAWLAWVAAWATIGLGSIASPDLMQRAFSAKSGKVARNSAFCAFAIVCAILVVVMLLTFAAMQMMEQNAVERALVDADPELLLPLVFQHSMPLPVVILFLGAVMAAVMSAAATANIALSGVIAKNLINDMFIPSMSSRGLMQTTRLIILLIGILGAYIAIGLPSAFLLTSLGFDLVLSCLFIPLTLGLSWKKANACGAVAGLIAGAFTRIVGAGLVNGFTLPGIASSAESWYYFTLGGPLAALVAMVVVSLATQSICKPIEMKLEPEGS